MRLGYASTFQTQFYDRSLVNKAMNAFNNVAPHGTTTRWTYTVPTGKKAFVNIARTSLLRTGAAAPVSTSGSEIDITALDASSGQLSLVRNFTNTVGDGGSQIASGIAPMVAGEILTATDVDNSTGGSIEFIQAAWVSEFSAA